jgi:hypothetical protein
MRLIRLSIMLFGIARSLAADVDVESQQGSVGSGGSGTGSGGSLSLDMETCRSIVAALGIIGGIYYTGGL